MHTVERNMKEIYEYLMQTYHPLAMITYGSYSNHTNNLNSDYDAVLICSETECFHDTNVIANVRLDVWGYGKEWIESLTDYAKLIQIWDGRIVLDTDNIAEKLQKQVISYIENCPKKTEEEKKDLKVWCEKMVERTYREDTEGMFRWHWLLVDSLEIYCDVRDLYYFGPKKTILRMKETDEIGYRLYDTALRKQEELKAWISYVFKE